MARLGKTERIAICCPSTVTFVSLLALVLGRNRGASRLGSSASSSTWLTSLGVAAFTGWAGGYAELSPEKSGRPPPAVPGDLFAFAKNSAVWR